MEGEDLYENPFFSVLTTTQSHIYSFASSKGYTILVPQKASLGETLLDEDLINCHVLMPSPIRAEEEEGGFRTLDGRYLRVFDHKVVTVRGWEEQREVLILSEELFYNAYDEPFKVFCIASPLVTLEKDIVQEEVPDEHAPDPDDLKFYEHSLVQSYADCLEYLSEVDRGQTLWRIVEEICSMNTTIVCAMDKAARCPKRSDVKEKLLTSHEAARDMLTAAATKGVSHMLKSQRDLYSNYRASPRCRAFLHSAIETFVVGGVFHTLFPSVCELFYEEDKTFAARRAGWRVMVPSDVGVREELDQCDFDRPKAEFDNMGSLCTPLEKLLCVKRTTHLISVCIGDHFHGLSMVNGAGPSDELAVTTDDLLAILICVVAWSTVTNLHAHVAHVEMFQVGDISSTDLEFCFVTLKAAVEFLANPLNQAVKTTKMLEMLTVPADVSTALFDSSPPQRSRSASSLVEVVAEPPIVSARRLSTVPPRGLEVVHRQPAPEDPLSALCSSPSAKMDEVFSEQRAEVERRRAEEEAKIKAVQREQRRLQYANHLRHLREFKRKSSKAKGNTIFGRRIGDG